MINLLPAREKQALLAEREKRIIMIFCFLVLFFLICLILILFSIKLYLDGQIEVQKAFLAESERQFFQSEAQDLQGKIELANSKFKELNSFYNQKIYFFEILEKISRTLPDTFYLTNFFLNFSEEKEIMISLSGFAPLREDLFEFKKNLEEDGSFKDVSFPPANWVEPSNIDFYVTFKIANK